MLTSGSWKITVTNTGWTEVSTYKGGATFTRSDAPTETGRWKISGNMIVQSYKKGKEEVISLPLNPKGTAGVDADGNNFTAVQLVPAPAPITVQDPEKDEKQKAATVAMLTAAPWNAHGNTKGWDNVRLYNKNGTFTTLNKTKEHGHWAISKDVITMTFADGHKDIISLPLDPKGTEGTTKSGEPITYTQKSPAGGN